jgi:hypothetical protein
MVVLLPFLHLCCCFCCRGTIVFLVLCCCPCHIGLAVLDMFCYYSSRIGAIFFFMLVLWFFSR